MNDNTKKVIVLLIILTACFVVISIEKKNRIDKKLDQVETDIEYTIYLSTWNSYSRASTDRDMLKKEGYNARVKSSSLPISPTVWHQVYIDGYQSLEAVKKDYLRLREKRMYPGVKKIWKDGHGQKWGKMILR